jgi:hypothetical protein
MSTPVNITVVIDSDSNECMYVEEDCWSGTGEITVYVTDLVEYSHGRPILLNHVSIEHVHEVWPDSLNEAIRTPLKITPIPDLTRPSNAAL